MEITSTLNQGQEGTVRYQGQGPRRDRGYYVTTEAGEEIGPKQHRSLRAIAPPS